jgi:hypothetical protein
MGQVLRYRRTLVFGRKLHLTWVEERPRDKDLGEKLKDFMRKEPNGLGGKTQVGGLRKQPSLEEEEGLVGRTQKQEVGR